MVEISLSGSGGGHGRVTSRGYPTPTDAVEMLIREALRRCPKPTR